MAMPIPIAYGRLTHAQILATKRLISHCNNMVEIPDGAQAGAITCNILTAAVPATVVEATAVAGSTATTQVNLTYVPEQVTHTLLPTQTASYFADPGNLAAIARAHADALAYSAENAIIADMYAATPGLSINMPAGDMNFDTDGSLAANTVVLKLMARLVSFCFASRQDANPEDFCIVMNYVPFGNFTALRSTEAPSPILNSTTGIYTFLGVPILQTLYATNFGIASRPAAFVFHKDAVACAFKEPFVMGGGPMWHYDACLKWTTIGCYAHGVATAGLIGEALNLAS